MHSCTIWYRWGAFHKLHLLLIWASQKNILASSPITCQLSLFWWIWVICNLLSITWKQIIFKNEQNCVTGQTWIKSLSSFLEHFCQLIIEMSNTIPAFFFLAVRGLSYGTWDLKLQHVGSSSLIRIWTRAPALGVWSPSHWTTRKIQFQPFKC